MKKLLVVLLSLGFVMLLSISAFAVGFDATGEYYARGSYYSNPSMLDQNGGTKRDSFGYWDQRLRLFMRLKIADGLTFTTRTDILETIWGKDQALRTGAPAAGSSTTTQKKYFEQFLSPEQSWVTFRTAIGSFNVGIKSTIPYGWGTSFMDSTGTSAQIQYQKSFGPVDIVADYSVKGTGDYSATGSPQFNGTDQDERLYDLAVKSKLGNAGEAGLLLSYFRNASDRPAVIAGVSPAVTGAQQLVTNANLQPYYKGTFGPVQLEAEGYWMLGKVQSDIAGVSDVDLNSKGVYVNGKFNVGPAYVGGMFIYASGDDPGTTDKIEGGLNSTFGYATDKALFGEFTTIVFNDDYHDYVTTKGDATAVATNKLDNAWLYQVYGGFAPTKKLDLFARFSYMKADQDPGVGAGWQSKNYGTELDVRATYKIYDQLTYNLGAAYLWTGDYFKGKNATASIQNVYYLLQWIDLNF